MSVYKKSNDSVFLNQQYEILLPSSRIEKPSSNFMLVCSWSKKVKNNCVCVCVCMHARVCACVRVWFHYNNTILIHSSSCRHCRSCKWVPLSGYLLWEYLICSYCKWSGFPSVTPPCARQRQSNEWHGFKNLYN